MDILDISDIFIYIVENAQKNVIVYILDICIDIEHKHKLNTLCNNLENLLQKYMKKNKSNNNNNNNIFMPKTYKRKYKKRYDNIVFWG